jgi:hypothetical protein
MSTNGNKPRKQRKRPIYNRVRQLEWLVWRMASEHKCCFCGELLFSGLADPKKLNITVHHINGSVHTDDRSVPSPIDEQLLAHGNCHKAYHHMERMIDRGMNVDKVRFRFMEKTVNRELTRLSRLA